MDAPQIQYATSADGTEIAYTTSGRGLPLVVAAVVGASHLGIEWAEPAFRDFYTDLARRYQVIRIDLRNHGLSTRGVRALGLDDFVADVLAVLDALGVERAAWAATSITTKVALRFAAVHPERTHSMVLQWAIIGDDVARTVLGRQLIAVRELIDVDWDSYADVFAILGVGFDEPEKTRSVRRVVRESCRPEDYRRVAAALGHADVSADLERVDAPVLMVLRDSPLFDEEPMRQITARLRNGRMTVLPGRHADPLDSPFARAIDGFLLPAPAPAAVNGAEPLTARQLEVIRLLAAGKSNGEIAEALVLSQWTVNRHVSAILTRLGAANRAEAVRIAVVGGLLGPSG